jgi:hypothetical protein
MVRNLNRITLHLKQLQDQKKIPTQKAIIAVLASRKYKRLVTVYLMPKRALKELSGVKLCSLLTELEKERTTKNLNIQICQK